VRLVSEDGVVLPEVVEIMKMAVLRRSASPHRLQGVVAPAKKARELGVRASLDHLLREPTSCCWKK
jgi:hypothetical protein